MPAKQKLAQRILESLQERAKELNCLYQVDGALSDPDASMEDISRRVVEALPAGFHHPEICHASLTLHGISCATEGFCETPQLLAAPVLVESQDVGELTVCYTEEKPQADEGPFLAEERKLLDTVAQRIGFFLMRRALREAHEDLAAFRERRADAPGAEWSIILEFLRRTDPNLLRRITRKMINHLGWTGIEESEALLQRYLSETAEPGVEETDENRPLRKATLQDFSDLSEETFRIAAQHFSEEDLISCIRGWIEEERCDFLLATLEDRSCGLPEVAEALERYRNTDIREGDLAPAFRTTLTVSLLRRLFTDNLDFINIAKNYVSPDDFHELINHVIFPLNSHGKLGGKSTGLFLATQIVRKSLDHPELAAGLKVPKTWYVCSDAVLQFVHQNDLEDLYMRKYMEVEAIRQEYPRVVQVFKNSRFPAEIVKGLALALDDLEDRPLIVRSSSLLEDQTGASFAGKYKSLFLANQGTKRERLAALQDAIAEVYASMFSPDPIEYRAERGLLDVHEEMGIMIQEVVGRRIGDYFLPAFAGVAFSNNEFRWSSRIKREDGLIRLVPGLGTRAVDRMSDDYPVLLAPGQPGLRVNVTPDEVLRYSPKMIDVINLETNTFETVDLIRLLRECGEEYPAVRRMVSIVEEGRIRKPSGLEPDFAEDDLVANFEGLISDTPFVRQMGSLLALLREKIGLPADIEFASDGESLYLLQCRTQSYTAEFAPAPIPRNISRDRLLFSAHRYISNGRVPDITHIVYVDPDRYAEIGDAQQMREVGRAVGRLNKLLPKRQFILLGPGRWGSRGDIKLGVNVTYSDLNNTAVLMEIARKKGSYVPELSFGTHFFQDLVEADIRYIPLYPDEPKNVFNELFLRRARNVLPDLLPEYGHLGEIVRVIDVPRETEGKILRVLLNADLDEAVGVFDQPTAGVEPTSFQEAVLEPPSEAHWRWRLGMAEKIAARLDVERFGVKAIYVFGSVKNATSGPASDIDLLVHDEGDGLGRRELALWLDGWSRSLAEINYLRTGHQTDGLLDVHYVTDEDIERQTSYAAKIGAITDPARSLDMGESTS